MAKNTKKVAQNCIGCAGFGLSVLSLTLAALAQKSKKSQKRPFFAPECLSFVNFLFGEILNTILLYIPLMILRIAFTDNLLIQRKAIYTIFVMRMAVLTVCYRKTCFHSCHSSSFAVFGG